MNREKQMDKFKEHYMKNCLSARELVNDIEYELHSEIHIEPNPTYRGLGIRRMISDKILEDVLDEYAKYFGGETSVDYTRDALYDFVDDIIQNRIEIKLEITTE